MPYVRLARREQGHQGWWLQGYYILTCFIFILIYLTTPIEKTKSVTRPEGKSLKRGRRFIYEIKIIRNGRSIFLNNEMIYNFIKNIKKNILTN